MGPPRPMIILMADDDSDDCFFVKEAFKENGMVVDLRFVEDGEDLLDYLHQRGKYMDAQNSPRPDLILLDLNMPRKDGREALREIKSDPSVQGIPIVILTTSRQEEDIVLTYDIGASSFITKPQSFNELLDVVKSLGKYWLEVVELPRRIN